VDRRVMNFVHRARCNPQATPSTSLVDHNIDRQWRKFLSPEFRAKFQRGVSELPTIPARRASTISNYSYFSNDVYHTHTHTHTHTRLTALFPGLPGSAGTRKVKPIWILLKQETEWQWHQLGHMQVCTSLQTDNHASNPPLSFLQAGCPSCRPTNSVKAKMSVTSTNHIDCCYCMHFMLSLCFVLYTHYV